MIVVRSTICDAYHASLLGPTDPNRYHMFSGWVGNSGAGGGPVVDTQRCPAFNHDRVEHAQSPV